MCVYECVYECVSERLYIGITPLPLPFAVSPSPSPPSTTTNITTNIITITINITITIAQEQYESKHQISMEMCQWEAVQALHSFSWGGEGAHSGDVAASLPHRLVCDVSVRIVRSVINLCQKCDKFVSEV